MPSSPPPTAADAARTEGAEHLAVLFSCLELAGDHLQGDEQGGAARRWRRRRTRAIASGFTVRFDLALDDRGDVEGIGGAPGQGGDDLVFDRRDPARAVAQLEPVAAVLRAGVEQVRERRGEKGKCGVAVDVVEHDLVVEHDRPDKASSRGEAAGLTLAVPKSGSSLWAMV